MFFEFVGGDVVIVLEIFGQVVEWLLCLYDNDSVGVCYVCDQWCVQYFEYVCVWQCVQCLQVLFGQVLVVVVLFVFGWLYGVWWCIVIKYFGVWFVLVLGVWLVWYLLYFVVDSFMLCIVIGECCWVCLFDGSRIVFDVGICFLLYFDVCQCMLDFYQGQVLVEIIMDIYMLFCFFVVQMLQGWIIVFGICFNVCVDIGYIYVVLLEGVLVIQVGIGFVWWMVVGEQVWFDGYGNYFFEVLDDIVISWMIGMWVVDVMLLVVLLVYLGCYCYGCLCCDLVIVMFLVFGVFLLDDIECSLVMLEVIYFVWV